MYLPAFHDIGSVLAADTGMMETSLSVFVGALAIGQLFYGPLADRFGRRGPLAFGIILFVLASVVAALSPNIAMFMIARALQGLGAAGGLVIARAIVADRFEGRDVGKIFSALMQVMMIVPIAAPPVGGLLLATLGWQAIFWLLAVIGAASLVAMVTIVPETLEPSRRTAAGFRAAILNYARLLKHGRLTWLTLSSSFSMAGLFVYIGSSSFVFIDHFGLTSTIYSLVYAGYAGGMMIGAQVTVQLLNRWTDRQLLYFGLWLHAGSAAALLCATLGFGAGLYVTGALIFLVVVSLMLVVGNGIALTMESAPAGHTGSASSLLGVVQYVFAGVTGATLGIAHDGTVTPFVVGTLLCASGALIAFVVATRLTTDMAPTFQSSV
jgi:MFS transporter, DHA1 family, multidrug resistance protein